MPYPNEPDHTPFGARLRERTAPLAPDDDAYGFAHAYLAEALMRPFREFQEAFDPPGDVPPMGTLLDPETCPAWALPWLAQFVGASIPEGATDEQARAIIANLSSFHRGTPAAMTAAAQAFLTGNKTVLFRERDGSAYRLEVVTYEDESPRSDRALPVNEIVNPSFEINTVGAIPYLGGGGAMSIERVAAAAYSGKWGLRVTRTAEPTNTNGGMQYQAFLPDDDYSDSEPIPLVWSAWVRAPVGRTITAYIDYDLNGAYAGTGINVLATGEWQRVVLTHTVPGGSTREAWSNQYIWIDGPLVGTFFDVDAAMLVFGTLTSEPYGDGDQPGWEWTVTPHASPSRPIETSIIHDVLLSQKPGGLILDYHTVAGWDYQLMRSESTTYLALESEFTSYANLRDKQRG